MVGRMDIGTILATLNRHKIRVTYSAIGQLLNIPAIAVGRRLGDKGPEKSWVVSSRTGKPTVYEANEFHKELFSKPNILRSGEELQALIDQDISRSSSSIPGFEKSSERRGDGDLRPSSLESNKSVRIGTRPQEGETSILGIDLAWKPDVNGSGLAFGTVNDRELRLNQVLTGVVGLDSVVSMVESSTKLSGIAIDAPLIIRNKIGSRPCENELNRVYRSRSAGCYPTNLTLLPNAASVRLADGFAENGFRHLGSPAANKWQIECYPHPAIIEIFGLDERLVYKKKRNRNIEVQRDGQIRLVRLIRTLEESKVLSVNIDQAFGGYFDEQRIAKLGLRELKENEDGLDAVICLYVAGLYAVGAPIRCFGDRDAGYIVVPFDH